MNAKELQQVLRHNILQRKDKGKLSVLTIEGTRFMQDGNSELWPPNMEFTYPLMHHCGGTHNETWAQPSKAEKKIVWLSIMLPKLLVNFH